MEPLSIKDFLKIFKNAPWEDKQALDDFVTAAPAVDSRTINQMLEVLCTKRHASDIRAHDRRLRVFRRVTSEVKDKALFAPFVRALKTGDKDVRAVVAPLIPKVNNYEEHPRLCGLLKSQDKDLRNVVCQVLKEVGGKTVLQNVTALIEERDFVGRNEAIDLIVPIAGHHAVPALRAALEVGQPAEKIKALEYLGDRRYMVKAVNSALKAIVPALDDDNDKVVSQAMESFSVLANEDDYFEFIIPFLESPNLSLVQAVIRGLRRFSSSRVLLALERKLRSGPNAIRIEVLNTLESLGSDEVLPLVVEALGHKQMSVRNRAAKVLTKLGKDRKINVARTVMWLLHSRNVNVRRMAVEVARSVRDPEGELWPKLIDFLRDEDWWVRERVRDALVDLAGKKLTPHMVALLGDPYDVVRRFAVDVLIQLGDPQALGALINTAREDEDWWTREKAIEAVGALKDERAIPYIIDIMRRTQEVQLVCIQTLKDLEARAAIPYIAELLDSDDPDIRIASVKCLGAFDAKEYAPKLQPMLVDSNPRVVNAVQEQLVYWNVEISEAHSVTRDKAVSFLDRMLMTVVESEGEDLILGSGRKPYMKRMGKIIPIATVALSHEQVISLLTPHLSVAHMEEMESLRDADFSYEVKQEATRFRVNIFQQNMGYGAVFRHIKTELPELEKLGLPEVAKGFGDLKHGLILVGGPTGSGKSTTLAALINYINRTSDRHVISLEDPIEVVHKSKRGLVNQREIGMHTKSFGAALRSTLRDDPDVILVGEMRDLTTIAFAVGAAETGHLVFGTVHTVSADTSVDRLLNAFPAKEQPQVRTTLAENLRAVVCQYLIKRQDGKGRVLVAEVMLNNDAIASLIRNGKTFQIPSVVATSRDMGMQSMDSELMRLFRAGVISADDAYMKSNVKKEFEEIFGDEDGEKKAESGLMSGLTATSGGEDEAPGSADVGVLPQGGGSR